MRFLFVAIPIIITPDTKQAYNITEGGNITCTATGYPVPDIVWLNNGSVVDKNRLVPISTMATGVSSMSVSMVIRRGDGGVYACVASNFLGYDSSTVNITVQCKL